ncbi:MULTISPECIES: cytosine permease [unclassified Oceanispirochaeta]|uniref:cytosine permease n=1 Tax=unclassified Oceanispirochaeta TaxID=2635722 RepID=UPI000E09C09A|nr:MULTISPECIES: cytosine permease [unclassified Oceanispirochaeta]MBF9016589.1 cytosine permease [Oceanispirochaeta sp. M2]NPD73052.1 cytosine permease [Oceanispirochaeta sp. M1]RDG31397.1 cytosine permease [Oceanispirochaeta sp. M1]
MSKQEKEGFVEQHALDQIPMNQRKNWLSIALIWAGAMISVTSLMVGGALVSGLTLGKAIGAGVVGYLIIMAFMVFQGMQGADLGRPTVVNAESSFGKQGAGLVISFVLGVSVMGWFAVQTSVAGAAFSGFIAEMGGSFPLWLSSLIWGTVMLVTAIVGIKALAYLNYIAVPALIILAVVGTSVAFKQFGVEGLSVVQPANPFPFFNGVAIAVGGFAVGGVIAADYSRYAKDRKGSMLSSMVGVLPLGIILIASGAVMAVVAGTYDITEVISSLGFPVLGFIILILATWTTNAVNAYSGGLAITSMFKLDSSKRAIATAVAGGIGTILAVLGFITHFISFLTVLTAGITPIAGVMIADYWIRNKGKAENWAPTEGINWVGIIAWLLGTFTGLFLKWGSSAINAIVVSAVCFLVLSLVTDKKGKLADANS